MRLGSLNSQVAPLLAYLSSISPRILVLNGQILDGEPTQSPQFPEEDLRVLKKIYQMGTSGTKIYCIHGRPYPALIQLRERSRGNFSFSRDLILDLDGKRAWFTHGDFLSSPLVKAKWANQLSDGLYAALAKLTASMRVFWKKQSSPGGNSEMLKKSSAERQMATRTQEGEAAAKLALRKTCEFVICGKPQESDRLWVENNKGPCQYLCAGDWTQNLTALEYNFKRWKTYRYTEDKRAPFFADAGLKEMNLAALLAKNRIA